MLIMKIKWDGNSLNFCIWTICAHELDEYVSSSLRELYFAILKIIPMRTQRFITIVCLLLWTVAHLHAYEKRNLLQKEADFEKVKSALIMGQKWVPYPDYSDRALGQIPR